MALKTEWPEDAATRRAIEDHFCQNPATAAAFAHAEVLVSKHFPRWSPVLWWDSHDGDVSIVAFSDKETREGLVADRDAFDQAWMAIPTRPFVDLLVQVKRHPSVVCADVTLPREPPPPSEVEKELVTYKFFLASLHSEAENSVWWHSTKGMKPTGFPPYAFPAARKLVQDIGQFQRDAKEVMESYFAQQNRLSLLEIQRAFWKAKAEGDEAGAARAERALRSRNQVP